MKTNNRGTPAGEEEAPLELTVDERLAILEKAIRRWQVTTFVLFLTALTAGACAICLRPAVHSVLRARRFEVINDKGLAVVSLNSDKAGGTLSSFNNEGRNLFIVGIDETGDGMVETYSSKGAAMVCLTTTPTGGTVQVFNNLGKEVVGLQSNKSNCGSIVVKDVNGGLRESLSGSRQRY